MLGAEAPRNPAHKPPQPRRGVRTPGLASSGIYKIAGVRSTQRGNPAQFVVNFGVGGGGGLTIASITAPDGSVKMAA